MCLISIVPKGKDKYSKEFIDGLTIASITNNDGIGFAYKSDKTKKVYISKGYKTIKKALAAMRNQRIAKRDELIVHLRIGNRGSINTDMCHPFAVSDNATDILQNHTITNLPVMAHNGTFYSYGSHNSMFSDTYHFIREFLGKSKIMDLLEDNPEFFKELFSTKLSTNRLVFLFPNSNTDFIKFGDWFHENGYYYSNASFKDKTIRNVGGNEYSSPNYLDFRDRQVCKKYNNRDSESFGEDLEEWDLARASDREEKLKKIIDTGNRLNSLSEINDVDDEDDNETDNDDNILNYIPCISPKRLALNETIITNNPKIKSYSSNVDLHSRIGIQIEVPTREDNLKLRSGYRKANNNEIQVETWNVLFTRSFKNSYNEIFYEYMGLYIPMLFKEPTQFNAIQIKPNIYNYTNLLLKCIKTDVDYGVQKGTNYVINSIPEEDYIIINKLNLSDIAKPIPYIAMPNIYISDLFEIVPLPKYHSKYLDYYRLVRDITPSKIQLTKLKDFMRRSEAYSKATTKFAYGIVGNVSRASMDLFKYNLVEEFFPNNTEKILNRMYIL